MSKHACRNYISLRIGPGDTDQQTATLMPQQHTVSSLLRLNLVVLSTLYSDRIMTEDIEPHAE